VVYKLNKELIRRGFRVITISYFNSDFYKETDARIIISKSAQNELNGYYVSNQGSFGS